MAVFDIRDYEAAIEEPELKVGGRVFRGRVLSAPEWAKWEERLRGAYKKAKRALDDDNPDRAGRVMYEVLDAVGGYVDAVFPRAWWQPWRRKASWHVLKLPPAQLFALLRDFLKSQGSTLRGPDPGTRQQD